MNSSANHDTNGAISAVSTISDAAHTAPAMARRGRISTVLASLLLWTNLSYAAAPLKIGYSD